MDPEVTSSPVAYPDEATLARGESFLALSTEATQKMDALWLDVKTSGSNTTTYLIAGGAALVVLVVLLLVLQARKKKKKARRGKGGAA